MKTEGTDPAVAHRQIFGESLYSAALRTVQDGRVLEVRVLQGGSVVTGIVDSGVPAAPTKFRVYIRNLAADVQAECSCGERGTCIHVAAVSIAAARTASSAAPELRVTRARSAGAAFQNAPVQQLCYVIEKIVGDSGSSGDAGVSVWVAQRASTVGSIVPGTACPYAFRFSPGAATALEFPRYVDAADRQILLSLVRQSDTRSRQSSASGPWVLTGQLGSSLLSELCSTGRLFHESLEQRPAASLPLREGAPRPVTFAWKLLPGGEQTLSWDGAESLEVFCNVEPPIYIDLAANELGRVDLRFEARVLRELAGHPPVPPEGIAAVNTRIEQLAGGTPFPRPGQITPILQPLCSLRPKLVLSAQERATLHFVYNDTPVDSRRLQEVSGQELTPGTNRVRLIAEGRLYEVPRDPDRERSFESQLAEALRNMTGSRTSWLQFMLQTVPALQAAGWEVSTDEGFPYRIAAAQEWFADLGADVDREAWFNLRLGVMVDGQSVNLLPALTRYLQSALEGEAGKQGGPTSAGAGAGETDGCRVGELWMVRLDDGRYLPIALERIQRIADTLVELFDRDNLTAGDVLALPRSQGARLAQLTAALRGPASTEPALRCADSSLAVLLQGLESFSGIHALQAPASFRGTLRPYQQEGLGWLQFLRVYRLGGILADDMGLGKTVQTLAHVALESEAGRLSKPVLIVSPVTALGNWRHELARFAPSLSVHTWHGSQRKKSLAQLDSAQVILTAYPLLPIDSDILLDRQYSLVILDEAQTIKNPDARVSQAARSLRAQCRLCLSGTPIENHLGELWSLFEFLQPGLLGDERYFQRHYRTPIEKNRDRVRAAALSARLAPFLLRRTKDSVARELPPKVEIVESITLDERQRDFYDGIRLSMHQRIQEIIRQQGLARSQITILDALLKLRQVCCDPRLLDKGEAGDIPSAKRDWIATVLPELVAEGRRILLFSQFTSMLRLLEPVVSELGIPYCQLTGETQNRSAVVQRFQSGEVPLFLLSLKAGGTALNLTAADTVIHYDPWWNPAVEAQATDRAHRIGQTQSVFVYKLITQDTVEEKMLQLQADKRALADQLYMGGSASPTSLTLADIEQLLA